MQILGRYAVEVVCILGALWIPSIAINRSNSSATRRRNPITINPRRTLRVLSRVEHESLFARNLIPATFPPHGMHFQVVARDSSDNPHSCGSHRFRICSHSGYARIKKRLNGRFHDGLNHFRDAARGLLPLGVDPRLKYYGVPRQRLEAS